MVTMLIRKSFEIGEANDYGGLDTIGLVNWWSEIEESEKWQQGIYYTLSASYALMSFVALVWCLSSEFMVSFYIFEWTYIRYG